VPEVYSPIISIGWWDFPDLAHADVAPVASMRVRTRPRKGRFSGWFLEKRWYCMS
jgi:hypothetical protein